MAHDSSKKIDKVTSPLNAEEVVLYLAEHPDFFVSHPDLIEKLTPPAQHQGQTIADFQHFMLLRLQDNLARLTAEKEALIATARSNLNNQTRIHASVLALLEAENFEQLIGAITTDLSVYLDVDIAALLIEAKDAEVVPMKRGEIRIVEPGQIDTWLGNTDIILRGNIQGDPEIYGPSANLIQSEALMRLEVSQFAPVGMLAFGSRLPDLFHEGQGTEQIGFLARVVERSIRAWLDLPA